jgi:hypothetical protein
LRRFHRITLEPVDNELNNTCTSHPDTQTLPISPKSGKIYEINRASVIGLQAIGKGQSAAEECLSFLGLSPVYTWHQHTKFIKEKVKNQSKTDFLNAVLQLKHFKLTIGQVDCTVKDLGDKVCKFNSMQVDLYHTID